MLVILHRLMFIHAEFSYVIVTKMDAVGYSGNSDRIPKSII